MQIQTQHVKIGANAAASVTFTQFTLDKPIVKGTVRAGTDTLPADNTFHFIVSPAAPVSMLVVDSGTGESSLYLTKALAISTSPAFPDRSDAGRARHAGQLREARGRHPERLGVSPGGGQRRAEAVRRARRRTAHRRRRAHDVAAGRNRSDAGHARPHRRSPAGRGATLGFLDHSHFVFEIFKAPRSGDFSAAQIYRYRRIDPAPGDRVLARFDDGAVAAAERKVGAGRVIVWASALDDSWTAICRSGRSICRSSISS